MVERWVKERAAKSYGGSCMSKFVQENERKRIRRLKNMKSSIVKMSSNKHDNWTQNKVEQRHREIRQSKKEEDDNDVDHESSNADFDLIFKPKIDMTKSGLKLKLKLANNGGGIDKKSGRIRDQSDKNEERQSKGNSVKTSTTRLQHTKSNMSLSERNAINEGKENQSPSHAAHSDNDSTNLRKVSWQSNKSMQKIRIATKKRIQAQEAKANCIAQKGKLCSSEEKVYESKKMYHKQLQQKKERRIPKKAIENSRFKPKDSQGKTFQAMKKKISPSTKRNQLHMNRGVSLDSLSRERIEALAILKEIDKGPSWGENKIDEMGYDNNDIGQNHQKKTFFSSDTEDEDKPSPLKTKSKSLFMDGDYQEEHHNRSYSSYKSTKNIPSPIIEVDNTHISTRHIDQEANLIDQKSLISSPDHDTQNLLDSNHFNYCLDGDDFDDKSDSVKVDEDLHEYRSFSQPVKSSPVKVSNSSISYDSDSRKNAIYEEENLSDHVDLNSSHGSSLHTEKNLDFSESDSHSDLAHNSVRSVETDQQLMHHQIRDESKSNDQDSEEEYSIYSEAFEGDIIQAANDSQSENMALLTSVTSRIEIDQNSEDEENRSKVDEIPHKSESSNTIDWTPQFEVESFFAPVT